MPTTISRILEYSSYQTPVPVGDNPSEPFGNGVVAPTIPGDGVNGQYFFWDSARSGYVLPPVVQNIPNNSTPSSLEALYTITNQSNTGQGVFPLLWNGATERIGNAFFPVPLGQLLWSETWTTDANLNPWTVDSLFQCGYGLLCQAGTSAGSINLYSLSLSASFTLPEPALTTTAATNITKQSAVVNGIGNSNQLWISPSSDYEVKFYFDFFGVSVLVGSASDNVSRAYSYTVNALDPNTTYSYRIKAITTSGGTEIDTYYGDTLTFTTTSADVPLMVF